MAIYITDLIFMDCFGRLSNPCNDKTAYHSEFRDKVEYHKKLISKKANLQEIKDLLDRFDGISDSIKQRLAIFEATKKEVSSFNKRLQELMRITQTTPKIT